MTHKLPPAALIRTWFEIIKNRELDQEVRDSTAQKLVQVFGSIEEAIKFYKSYD